jgi:deoxycytidylate deaminase
LLHARLRRKIVSNMNKRSAAWVPDGLFSPGSRHDGRRGSSSQPPKGRHAERHAIFEAARRGIATAGAHHTTTFLPCIDRARAIVDSGIACLDAPSPAFDDPVWGASFDRSEVILREGGVEMRIV